jgi:4-amino-4-deoxy-L-arabinose transferase-like glycosyltransferase
VLRLNPSRARLVERWLPAFVGGFYALAAGLVALFRFAFEIDPDEGYNLMKVLLVERGHALYTEVWSDQPPAFTYLGVLAVRVFGERPESVRLVTALLSGALVFALADLLRREWPGFVGLAGGLCVALFLSATRSFASYSVAAMIGLPSIAFATLALWALRVSESRRRGWLVAAGALFGASLVTKLFTLFLLPLLAVLLGFQIYAQGGPERLRAGARALAFWTLGFAGVLLLGLGPVLAAGEFEQLYATHAAGAGRAFRPGALFEFLEDDVWLYTLAVAGLGVAIVRRRAVALLCGAWCSGIGFALLFHTPLWRHHALLLAVPAALLAGVAAGSLLELVRTRLSGARRGLVFVCLGVPLLLGPLLRLWPRAPSTGRVARQQQYAAVGAVVQRHARNAKLMVSSRQMYAFRAGVPVPPELAVTSSKRFKSGALSGRKIRELVVTRRPEIVVLDRLWPEAVSDTVRSALRSNYRLVFADERASKVEVYVRSSRDPR